jgi:hypothetical protein
VKRVPSCLTKKSWTVYRCMRRSTLSLACHVIGLYSYSYCVSSSLANGNIVFSILPCPSEVIASIMMKLC